MAEDVKRRRSFPEAFKREAVAAFAVAAWCRRWLRKELERADGA